MTDLDSIDVADARPIQHDGIYELLNKNPTTRMFTKPVEPIRECYKRIITYEAPDVMPLRAYYLEDIRIDNHPYEFYLLDSDADLINSTSELSSNDQDEQYNNTIDRQVDSRTSLGEDDNRWQMITKIVNIIRLGNDIAQFPSSVNGHFNSRENLDAVATLNNIRSRMKFNPTYAIARAKGHILVNIVWDKNRPNNAYDKTRPIVIHEVGINFVYTDVEAYCCCLAFST